MEIVLLLGIIALPFLLYYLYTQQTDRRENEPAKRLERLHDPNAASGAVDGLIAQSKIDSEIAKEFGKRGPWL